jgi:hypothetical protein
MGLPPVAAVLTADRKDGTVVGVRHSTGTACACRICLAHRR